MTLTGPKCYKATSLYSTLLFHCCRPIHAYTSTSSMQYTSLKGTCFSDDFITRIAIIYYFFRYYIREPSFFYFLLFFSYSPFLFLIYSLLFLFLFLFYFGGPSFFRLDHTPHWNQITQKNSKIQKVCGSYCQNLNFV